MAEDIIFRRKARRKLLKGIKKVYNAVKVTLGPRGNNVMIGNDFFPMVVNDGFLIANKIKLDDVYEHLGAKLIIEACNNTNDEVGDGTTSTIILTASLIFGLQKLRSRGYSGALLRQSLLEIQDDLHDIIHKLCIKDVSDLMLEQVASVAAKSAYFGQMLVEIYKKLGRKAAIIVSEGLDSESKYVIEKGIVINRGFLTRSSIYVKKVVLKKPLVMVIPEDYKIEDILSLCTDKALLIFTKIDGQDLIFLNQYIISSKKEIVAIKKDEDLGKMKDIQVFCQMKMVKNLLIGRCEEVVVTAFTTTLISDVIDEEYLKDLEEEMHTASEYQKRGYKERIGAMTSGIARIIIGANSEVELQDLKYRLEDAINACEQGIKGGVLRGEGLGYVDIASELANCKKTAIGRQVLKVVIKALNMPKKLIMKNAGLHLKRKQAYDFVLHKYVNDNDFMLYDPMHIIERSIINAISVASMFAIIEAVVINKINFKSLDV